MGIDFCSSDPITIYAIRVNSYCKNSTDVKYSVELGIGKTFGEALNRLEKWVNEEMPNHYHFYSVDCREVMIFSKQKA